MSKEKLTETQLNEALTPAELIKIHASNPKHVITDDEIRRLKVGGEVQTKEELKREIEEKEAEDNCGHNDNNCYDILDA